MLTAFSLITILALPAAGGPPPDSLVTPSAAAEQLRVPTQEWASLMVPAPLTGLRPLGFTVPGEVGVPAGSSPQIIEYSDWYFRRATIHKWASYLTVPLFAGQYYVGSKLIDGDESMRGMHGALTGAIASLFVVNTVTGVWNAWDARKDPEGRTRRTLHSILMLVADAGFVVTGSLASESEGGAISSSDNNAHRSVAIASMATALVSYAIMLPFFRNDE